MVFSEIRWIAILFFMSTILQVMTPIQLSYLSSLLSLDEFPSLHFSFRITRASKSLILYPLSFWQFQTLSLPPHLLFFQPWRVPIYIVNVEISIIAEHALLRSRVRFYLTPDRSFNFLLESQPTVFSFLNFSIYIILYFFIKINYSMRHWTVSAVVCFVYTLPPIPVDLIKGELSTPRSLSGGIPVLE